MRKGGWPVRSIFHMVGPVYAVVLVALLRGPAPAAAGTASEAARDTVVVSGWVADANNGHALAGAVVEVVGRGQTVAAGDDGRFRLEVVGDRPITLRVWAYGYLAQERALDAAVTDGLRFALVPRPVGLPGLTARAVRTPAGAAAERDLYQREVTPAVVGIGGQEAAHLPVTLEPDLLRSLQALPGIVAVNDLSARLHVRGGGPDQNLFLMDGTRIYAPYHMFGIFGSFNPDAVGRVELYRGAIPARYGGVLSSVVDIEQRDGAADRLRGDLGLSLLAARATASGRTPGVEGRWMLAFRESLVDRVFPVLFGLDSPVAFHDLQGRISVSPTHRHRLRATFYRSGDDFEMFLDDDTGLESTWRNRAGSLRWDASLGAGMTGAVTAWTSGYDASVDVGSVGETPVTRNVVESHGLKSELGIQGTRTGARVGLELEVGRLDVLGSERPGGYVEGETRRSYDAIAAFTELEVDVGRFRLVPGVRVVRDARGQLLVEPRTAARMSLGADLDLSVAAGRSHQVISTVRDDRYPLPGAPIFFLHPADAPAARSDGLTASLDGWLDRATSVSVGGFARRFRGLPWWRPAGSRDLTSVRYVDGRAAGFELMVRRHHEDLHGWIGYGLSWVDQRDPDLDAWVAAPWDRRHALDAALVWEPGSGFAASGRVVYGSGLPFWPQTGLAPAKWVDPATGQLGDRSPYPLWAAEQLRNPDYFRFDLGVRGRVDILGARWEPYLSVRNLTGRPNVLLYSYRPSYDNTVDPPQLVGGTLHPQLGPFSRWVPALGIEVQF